MRVVLSGGRYGTTSASEVSNIVNECKSNNLVCILEDHDTTGYGDTAYAADAKSLSDAVQFWKSVGSAVKGQEDYVMINLGNEPYGNNTASQWTQGPRTPFARCATPVSGTHSCSLRRTGARIGRV